MKFRFHSLTMKTWVCTGAQRQRQVLVLKIVLNVSHFMMYNTEIFHVYVRTHFYAKIFPVAKIPCGCVTLNNPIRWFFDNRFARVAHVIRWQTQTGVEFICHFEHLTCSEIELVKCRCHINQSGIFEWSRIVV